MMVKAFALFAAVVTVASATSVKFHNNVRSFTKVGDQYEVTTWENARVFRFKENDPRVHCFRNAYQSKMKVDMEFDEAGDLKGCKLAGHALPGTPEGKKELEL